MRGKGRLLILLVQVSILDPILGTQASVARGLGKWNAAIVRPDLAIGEFSFSKVEADLLSDHLAQLEAGGIDTGGRVVTAPLAPRAGRDRQSQVPQANNHLFEGEAHHLRGSLRDDRITPCADVRLVGFDGHDAGIFKAALAPPTSLTHYCGMPLRLPSRSTTACRGSGQVGRFACSSRNSPRPPANIGLTAAGHVCSRAQNSDECQLVAPPSSVSHTTSGRSVAARNLSRWNVQIK